MDRLGKERKARLEKLFGSEWPWLYKLATSMHDHEATDSFFDTAEEKKTRDPKYSLYQDFPRPEAQEKSAKEKAREECFAFVFKLGRPHAEASPSPASVQTKPGEPIDQGAPLPKEREGA